jgi:long-chain acyl-CoA synthetase
MLLHDFLLHAERTSASRTAVVDGALRRNYGEVAARVRRAAAGLASRGLTVGQRVAILAENTSGFYEAYFALSFAGLTAVPINTRLSRSEIAFILRDCECAALLVDDASSGTADAPGGCTTISLGPGGACGWEELIRSSAALEAPRGPREEDAVAHIFYTGGTTGRPKGVMLSHRNVVASSMNKVMLGSFGRDDVWLHAAPMFHQADAWAVFSFTGLGAAHVFAPSFSPARALDLIEEHGVTGSQLVPTMIFMLLEEPGAAGRDLSRVRRILYGSAPMPSDLLARASRAFGNVFQHIYGLTEAAGTVAATPWPPIAHEAAGARLTSCGQPLVGVELRIAGGDGKPVPVGRVGRIQVRGANVMRAYWKREVETAAAFVDGWLDTGDIGRLDGDGFVFIVDRAKDMIISGGENVYSTEVEDVIHAHPDVAEAAVIGAPDPRWGETVVAVVSLHSGAQLTQAGLIAHCEGRLARYKCPKSVRFVDALPRSATGKVLKHVLRDMLADGGAANL